MNYLAIDTSGDLLVLLEVDNKQFVRHLIGCQTKHSLTLMPYVEELLNEGKIALKDLDFIAVVVGPGSFTGIRIGVATAKALAFANDKKILPLTSFDLLAYYSSAPKKSLCLIDANHDNYYICGYENKKVTVQPSFADSKKVEELLTDYIPCSSTEINIQNVVLCDTVDGMKNAIKENSSNLRDHNEIYPLYVKRSQAEEENC